MHSSNTPTAADAATPMPISNATEPIVFEAFMDCERSDEEVGIEETTPIVLGVESEREIIVEE